MPSVACSVDAATAALVAVEAAGVAVLLLGERRNDLRLQWLGKPVASLSFVALAWVSGAADSGYGRAVLAACFLSLAGDLFLIPAGDRAFRAGIAAFFAAHVAYLVAFVMRGFATAWLVLAAALLAVVAFAVARNLLPTVPRPLRVAVTAYVVVVTAMVAAAAGTAFGPGPEILVVAAGAFYVSDLLVARHKFVSARFGYRLAGLPLYYAAQTLFALTIAQT